MERGRGCPPLSAPISMCRKEMGTYGSAPPDTGSVRGGGSGRRVDFFPYVTAAGWGPIVDCMISIVSNSLPLLRPFSCSSYRAVKVHK